jgi:transglutaminase-like putative cysteine protease
MPFMEDYRGTGIYKLEDLAANTETRVNTSWKVEVYRVETTVRPQQIRQDPLSPVNAAYIQSNQLIPSDDPRIKNRAAQIIGRERNPYLKARMIFEWLLKERAITEGRIDTDIFAALETGGQADAYTAVLLYCTLLRSAGVPARPVAGVLVTLGLEPLTHYWAEFWVDGFGWIPVDPAMAAGAVPASFNRESREDFYFGNIDSRRIAFSRGFAVLSPMTPGGRTVSLERSYALQSLWEEASGGLDSYTSLWGDVVITGIYAQ